MRIVDALKGGSTCKLFSQPFIPLPMVVNSLDDPSILICDPQGVKDETQKYFKNLYDHTNVPDGKTVDDNSISHGSAELCT